MGGRGALPRGRGGGEGARPEPGQEPQGPCRRGKRGGARQARYLEALGAA